MSTRAELNQRSLDLLRTISEVINETVDQRIAAAVERCLYYSAPQAHRYTNAGITAPDLTGLGLYRDETHRPQECGCAGTNTKFNMPIHPPVRTHTKDLDDGTVVTVWQIRTMTAYLPETYAMWWGGGEL